MMHTKGKTNNDEVECTVDIERYNRTSKMTVKCNDGFSLKNNTTDRFSSNDQEIYKASRHGKKALLWIEEKSNYNGAKAHLYTSLTDTSYSQLTVGECVRTQE
jgi:hypothetical protein